MKWEELFDDIEEAMNTSDVLKKSIEVEGDKVENRGADDLIKLSQFARIQQERAKVASPFITGRVITSNGGDGLV